MQALQTCNSNSDNAMSKQQIFLSTQQSEGRLISFAANQISNSQLKIAGASVVKLIERQLPLPVVSIICAQTNIVC